nr:sugar ABC transporter ATP-binding protein [Sporanaerobium hydrogeniformans]
MEERLLVMEGIDKSFPGVHALDHCRFDLKAGEVHALVGENGAGKSTLMKILTGVYTKDEGKIIYKGKEIHVSGTKEAQEMGICIVHQELNLMPHLTVAQNMFIGREFTGKNKAFVNDVEANRRAQVLFDKMNLKLDPKTKVGKITVAMQQMVEIAKALSFDSSVLVMDEPTTALTESETEELFKMIKLLKEKGVGIVYISHRMEEIKRITDRITVMRDGMYVDTVNTAEVEMSQVINMMVGRTIFETANEENYTDKENVVLEVKNLNRGKAIKNVSFKLHKGEILGLSGLMGAGRTEVARAIFGADKFESGEIYVKGQKVKITKPLDAVNHGIGYLSEDRKRYGLTLSETVEQNISLASIDRYTNKLGFTNMSTITEMSQEYVNKLSIKTPSTKQKAKNLSGGNQQKVVIAKWLLRDCDILIFDEPTKGIDVGAKSEIYKLLSQLAKEGKAIIMISSELPEILRMSNRIVVMCEGRITGELDIKDATQEEIMKYATKREA